MANQAERIAAAVWSALNQFRWFGKHVEEEALDAAYGAVKGAINGALHSGSPRVVVVQMAEDWEALYVEGQLVYAVHAVTLDDIEAHLPDLKVERIEVTEGQWGAWGFSVPKTLEEL